MRPSAAALTAAFLLAARAVGAAGKPPLPAVSAASPVFAGARSAQKAVLRAADVASDSVEVDLQLTREGTFVLWHDETFAGRPVAGLPAAAMPGVEEFGAFVEKLARRGRRLAYVHLDLKSRFVLRGPMRKALDRAVEPLERLGSLSEAVVVSSPFPAVYEDILGFAAQGGPRRKALRPAFDLVDYGVEDAERWGLPMTFFERRLLPAARLANRLYLKAARRRVALVTVREETAASWDGPQRLICWSREQQPGPVPERCAKTEREVSAPSRAPGPSARIMGR
ncbi:MAG: hypothetical protein HY927_03880 [Elusimicrobia bacterium]|nr:hypothetical protein [Elusimicrobiota bacterium]